MKNSGQVSEKESLQKGLVVERMGSVGDKRIGESVETVTEVEFSFVT